MPRPALPSIIGAGACSAGACVHSLQLLQWHCADSVQTVWRDYVGGLRSLLEEEVRPVQEGQGSHLGADLTWQAS